MKMIKWSFVFAFFAATFAVQAQTIDEGKKQLDNENFGKAREIFNAIITREPMNGEAYYYLGETYYQDEKPAEAKATYEKGFVATKGDNPHVLVGKAKIALDEKNEKEATKLVEKSIRASRNRTYREGHPDIYALVGKAYLDSKNENLQEAVNNFTRARDIEPKSARYWILLGDAQLKKGDPGSAMTAYETAAEKDKANPETFLKMGRIWGRSGKYDLSLEKLDAGLLVGPEYAPLYKDNIEYSIAAKKYSRVTPLLDKYLKLSVAANDFDARARFVKYLASVARDYDRAVEEAYRLIKDDPTRLNINRWIAYARVAQGLSKEADGIKVDSLKATYTEAIEASKRLFAALKADDLADYDYKNYATAAQKVGDLDLMASVYKDQLKVDTTKTAGVLGLIAKSYWDAKKYKQAYRAYADKLGKYEPASSELYYQMVSAYYGSFGKDADKVTEKEIESAADRYIAVNDKAPDGYFYKGKAQDQQDTGDQPAYLARTSAEKVIELGAADPVRGKTLLIWAYNYMASFNATTNPTLAKEFIQKTLALDPTNKRANELLQALGGGN